MIAASTVKFVQSPLSPVSTTKKLKEGGKSFPLVSLYGRFLSINNANTTPTPTIAMIIPMIPGTKYKYATEVVCVGCGVGGAAASSTTKAV